MTGITLATAQAQLDLWVEADARVSKNQSYSIAGRSLTRADAGTITEKIDYWQRQVSRLSARAAGRSRVRYIVGE
jgi:hypothetical protein